MTRIIIKIWPRLVREIHAFYRRVFLSIYRKEEKVRVKKCPRGGGEKEKKRKERERRKGERYRRGI